MNSKPELILVRHGEVEPVWKSICYGAMDVQLSEVGVRSSLVFADLITRCFRPAWVVHSGLMRTRLLAQAIAEACTEPSMVCEDVRLRERHYGQWQGRSWDEAYASDPENFHGLIEHPDSYRPPEGETTSEMQTRIVAWYRECFLTKPLRQQPVVVVAHSGPIAALAGHLLQLHARDWQPWTLKPLQAIAVSNLCPGVSPRCEVLDLLSVNGNAQ